MPPWSKNVWSSMTDRSPAHCNGMPSEVCPNRYMPAPQRRALSRAARPVQASTQASKRNESTARMPAALRMGHGRMPDALERSAAHSSSPWPRPRGRVGGGAPRSRRSPCPTPARPRAAPAARQPRGIARLGFRSRSRAGMPPRVPLEYCMARLRDGSLHSAWARTAAHRELRVEAEALERRIRALRVGVGGVARGGERPTLRPPHRHEPVDWRLSARH